MQKLFSSVAKSLWLATAAAACLLAASGTALAQDAPVPPHVEEQPVAAGQDAYCYGGPHPVDTRVAAGGPWDETHGNHTHFYPPFDLRLYTFKDGCYHFVGDPRDFGYRGDTYSYYGAHPVNDVHGGGWCFMIGGHGHWWRPWSPYFVVAGPWYYWHGPYDPFFHSYWPYYATYYRSYYPRYYGGGRFHRGRRGGWAVAPPVGRVAAPARGMPANAAPVTGGGMAGGAAPARATRGGSGGWTSPSVAGSPGVATAAPAGGGWTSSVRGRPAAAQPAPSAGWGSAPGWGSASPSPSWGSSVRTAPSAGSGSFQRWSSPSIQSSPSFRSAPSSGSFRSAPSGSFRSAPSSGGGGMRFMSPSSGGGSSSGGFRSGGGRVWSR